MAGLANVTIPALETRYRGFRFRSRLEGKWAVFFDAIGIKFQYEAEGFAIPGIGGYLPDFYLPQVRMWAEVKPERMSEAENAKCIALAEFSMRPVLHLIGPPEFMPYIASHFEKWDGETMRYEIPYSLDIAMHDKAWKDGRLFSQPSQSRPEDYSVLYRGAIYTSRYMRFEEEQA